MTISRVIFDVDGVIFDTEKIHISGWEIIFGRRGFSFPKEVYESGFGVCDREFLLKLKKEGRLPPETEIEIILEEKVEATLKLIDGGAPFFPSVVETIKQLSGNLPLACASNSDSRFVHLLLEKSGLKNCFQLVLTRKEVTAPKPSPEIYLTCARKMKVVPCQCLVIEDSPVGVAAAKSAGMICLAVTHTTPAQKLSAADFIISQLTVDEIYRVIRRSHG
ncbi:MAG: HAD family phosphatase [Candidatus Omnitrophica bacterium]|nr:HAD family phosphatase [Candidatus Omnitrophota bacterium]